MSAPCRNMQDLIADVVSGFAKSREIEQVQAHLDKCPNCREYAQALQSEAEMLEAFASQVNADAHRRKDRIKEELDSLPVARRLVFSKRALRKVAVLAGAAVFMAAALVSLATMNTGDERSKGIVANEASSKQDVSRENEQSISDWTLEQEFDLCDVFYANKDVDGLITMLYEGKPDTQLLAATYLADIGDEGSIRDLQVVAQAWDGEGINQFQLAAERISERLRADEEPKQIAIVPTANDQKDALNGADEQNIIVASPASEAPANYGSIQKPYLSGRVTDILTGEPVEGIKVKLYGNGFYKTKTDSTGAYHFTDIAQGGNYVLDIKSNTYLGLGGWRNAPILALRNGVTFVHDLELEKGCSADVTVTDHWGSPVEHARVEVKWLGSEHPERESFAEARTDENGLARLGAVKVSNVPYMVSVWHDDFAPAEDMIPLTSTDEKYQCNIALERGQLIEGYAVYSDDVPAEGVRILVRPKGWNSHYHEYETAKVDEYGYFVLENIVPGDYSLWARFDTGAGEYTYPLKDLQLPQANADLLVLDMGQKSPQSMYAIQGRFECAGDVGSGRISVTVYSAGEFVKRVTLRPRKTREFRVNGLEAGTYNLTFRGKGIETVTYENIAAGTQELEVTLEEKENIQIRGAVVAGDGGAAVRQFRLRVHKETLDNGRSIVGNWFNFRSPDGKFEIPAIGPGIYRVQVDADGWAPTWSSPVDTSFSDELVVELQQGGNLTGRVVDVYGNPILGAKVLPFSIAGDSLWIAEDDHDAFEENGGVETDENGLFVFEDLPAGEETLKVIHASYIDQVITRVPVGIGELTSGVEIVLETGGGIEGYVFDDLGNAEPNVKVAIRESASDAAEVTTVLTNEMGYYHIAGLPAKEFHVFLQSQDNAENKTVVPVAGSTIRVDFGTGQAESVDYSNESVVTGGGF